MRGIGIDLGLGPDPTACMLARFDAGAAEPLAWWTLQPQGGAWPARVARLGAALRDLLRRERPDFAVWAEPYLKTFTSKTGKTATNAQTLRKLAALEGALVLACADAGVPAVMVAEAHSKQALAGDHRADKAQMVAAARMYYRLDLSEHEADALGHLLAGEAKLRLDGLATRAAV